MTKAPTKKEAAPIQYEPVTIQVPKNVLEYYRVMTKLEGETLEEALQYELVAECAAHMEGVSPTVMMGIFNS